MKKMISRRQLLYFSALFSLFYPIANLKSFAVADDVKKNNQYPLTIDILKEAYWAEMIANKHYDGYCQKALSQNYPNIAYLFTSLSISEKIHAEISERQEKFEKAFTARDLDDASSREYGIDSRTSTVMCENDDVCDSDKGHIHCR